MTVNDFVCAFARGTRIKVHMIFADERLYDPNKDYGVWGNGDYFGITRYPVGECQVCSRSARCFRLKSDNYDVHVWCYEPNYFKKLDCEVSVKNRLPTKHKKKGIKR